MFVTCREFSQISGISEARIRELAKSGKLPFYRPGKRNIFIDEDAGMHILGIESKKNAETVLETMPKLKTMQRLPEVPKPKTGYQYQQTFKQYPKKLQERILAAQAAQAAQAANN